MRKQVGAKAAVLLVTALAVTPVWAAKELRWTAGNQRTSVAEGREYTLLSDGAVVQSDSTEIRANEIELYGDEFRYVVARGDVTVRDDERGILLDTDELFYDREREITRVDRYFEMQDLKNEVVVKGSFFEYFGDDDVAIIQIGVRILKVDEDTELACRSESARYDRGTETLELSGMPRVVRNEDLYQANLITIDLQTDEIFLKQGVTGRIVQTEEQESGTAESSRTDESVEQGSADTEASDSEE